MSGREALNMKLPPIQSTAGAVPIRNEKGEISMEKVKVKRYVSGKRPDYAPMESSDEEEEDFQFVKKGKDAEPELEEEEVSDPRLKRLLNRVSEDVEERLARHRQIAEPELIAESSEDSDEGTWHPQREESSEEEEEEEEEEEDYSEPDIEEELLASEQLAGPADDEEEENGEAEAGEGVKTVANGNASLIVSEEEEEGNATATQEAAGPTGPPSAGLCPLTDSDVTDLSPVSLQELSPGASPPGPPPHGLSNGVAATVKREALSAGESPRAAAELSPPPSPAAAQTNQDSSTATCDLLSSNGKSSPLSLRFTRGRKRKREEKRKSHIHALLPDSDMDLTLDMGLVLTTPPPRHSESARPDDPTHDLLRSSQSTPPPKKNKVNVATQCDPDEIIVLSDSE